jgi:hypothetical protein
VPGKVFEAQRPVIRNWARSQSFDLDDQGKPMTSYHVSRTTIAATGGKSFI